MTPMRRRLLSAALAAALLAASAAGFAGTATAQDTTVVRRDTAVVAPDSAVVAPDSAAAIDAVAVPDSPAQPDTAEVSRVRPLSPSGALWRSLLLPGWGQARLGRKLSATIFIGFEGIALGMSIKTSHQLHYLRRTGSTRAEDKAQQRQDWLVLLAFNHVLAGLEAYVAANLADFPGDLRIEAVPGGVGGVVTVPFRLR